MRRRIIPVLLLDADRRLVKTIGFGERTYIGDPFNVIRLFNEKEVDEICLLDIDARKNDRGPDLAFMEMFASECFMPLAYGGGIRSLQECEQLNRVGVEKFVLGSVASDRKLVHELVGTFGSQAVTACLDYTGSGSAANCLSPLGHRSQNLRDVALDLVASGVGELIIQSVDRDGRRAGMDLDTITSISNAVEVPVVALGGAGDRDHLVAALDAGASAVASGSAFSFIGRLRAVLISYPSSLAMSSSSTEMKTS